MQTDILAKGVGLHCPLMLSMTVSRSSIEPFDTIEIQWRVQILNLQALNLTQIMPSAVSSNPDLVADVVHSNVHSCAFGSNCDPFHDGRQSLTPTPNQWADFNDPSSCLEFRSQALTFTQDGMYTLVGHVIVFGPGRVQYDFAVYDQLLVKTKNTSVVPALEKPRRPKDLPRSIDSATTDDQHWSLVGILVGTLALLLFSLMIVYVLVSRKQVQRLMSSSGTATHEHYTTISCITPTNPQHERESIQGRSPRVGLSAAAEEDRVFYDTLYDARDSSASPRFQDANGAASSSDVIESGTSTTPTVHDIDTVISLNDRETYAI